MRQVFFAIMLTLSLQANQKLDNYYDSVRNTSSDINEHIETLCHLASECEHVTEFGVRTCVSSWAFLKGLKQNKSRKKELRSCDCNYHATIETVKKVAKKNKIGYTFELCNDLDLRSCSTDMLFIDTWHVYGHLKRELAIHAHNAKKYIVMHDTTVDAEWGESIRLNHNIEALAQKSGYPIEEISRGIWPAIAEFLEENPEWVIKERYLHNNGLTVLMRSSLTEK